MSGKLLLNIIACTKFKISLLIKESVKGGFQILDFKAET